MGGSGTVGTAGRRASQLRARLWVEAGIQLGTLQGMESGIRKLDASFKHRAKNRAKPQNVPWGCLRCFGKKRSVEMCNARDSAAAEVLQAAVGNSLHTHQGEPSHDVTGEPLCTYCHRA